MSKRLLNYFLRVVDAYAVVIIYVIKWVCVTHATHPIISIEIGVLWVFVK